MGDGLKWRAACGKGGSVSTLLELPFNPLAPILLREAPLKLSPGLFGHCPDSDCAPRPSVNRALWGTLFSDRIEQFCQITVLMVLSAPNHPGKHFGPLHNQAITHLNFNFHCISAPNHPGKHFDPPQSSKLPIWGGELK